MPIVETKHHLPYPIERTWPLLSSFGDIDAFHPLIERSHLTHGREGEPGARRECTFYDGSVFREELLEVRPERSYALRITDFGKVPVKSSRVSMAFAPKGGGTEVTFRNEFVPKFGPLGWLMAQVAMKPFFRKLHGRIFDAAEEYLRTGRKTAKTG